MNTCKYRDSGITQLVRTRIYHRRIGHLPYLLISGELQSFMRA